ncbi:MAG TPA: site-specific DNA-methyltransferase [Rhabdochlamydiaceae bacterium]|nr:site-specific DNA-methyltransferase [Rhabdochlamydiaceae bacterium]HSX38211.1 site-specific DNA-methyltransferase [Chlamydiales bacterium]
MSNHPAPSVGLGLTWPTKHRWESPETRILVSKEVFCSERKGQTENLLIRGDNLLGLKALEQKYREKIRCVYIDPPYNTKSCFAHYDDSFEHSLWLDMMKERLKILERLLRKDGTIWISIDDDECHYLKVLCDEIFERKNFVANVIWEKKYSPQNDAKWLSDSHDHILVYAKNIDLKHWGRDIKKGLNLLPRTEEMDARYKNPDNDPRGAWKPSCLSVKTYSASCDYPIRTPSGRIVNPPSSSCWGVSQDKFRELVRDNRIWFGFDGKNVPSLKRFLSEVQDGIVSKTIWPRAEVGDNQEAKREVISFNPKDVFATPKPERLIQRILYLATDPGDIVLDCFAGSGTTGAVANKMKRRWIMIEMGKHAETHIIPRLQKVIEGTDPGGVTEMNNWKGGGGFRYCELAPTLFEKNRLGRLVINKQYNTLMLAEAICEKVGFTFDPKSDPYWIHGYSTERDFIYVVPREVTNAELQHLSDEVGASRSLMVMCTAFRAEPKDFTNLTIKKIPKELLNRCEWGRDDYSLRTALETEAELANKPKRKERI